MKVITTQVYYKQQNLSFKIQDMLNINKASGWLHWKR